MSISTTAADAFKQRDATSYDAVSESFAHFTARFSKPVADHMVDLATLSPSDHVLDVGTGTGVVALAAARRLDATGQVSAIDLSVGMLATAKRIADLDSAGRRVDWRSMDAESLEFANAQVDVVLSLFALLHFPNPLAALREMHRVLKPGGKLVLALGSRPPLNTVAGLSHALYMLPRLARRKLGWELAAPAFLDALVEKYLPKGGANEQSVLAEHSHGHADSVQMLARQAGFTDITIDWVGYNHKIQSADEFWELQRTFSSLARKRINEASAAHAEALQSEFMVRCKNAMARGGTLVYPVGVLFICARKSGQS